MKEFMPQENQNKKAQENVLAISAKAREEKAHNPAIINATSGTYYDEDGNIKVFECVKDIFNHPNYNNILTYSSVTGSKSFLDAVKKWIFGDDYEQAYPNYYFNAIATPGGTGALTMSLATYLTPSEGIMLPNIMWPVYTQMATNLNIKPHLYELFDEQNKLNLASIKKVAQELQTKYQKVALIINDPCHNPTGYSMTKDDYVGLIDLLNELATKTKVILILDIAYLDYGHSSGQITRKHFKLLTKLSSNVMTLFTFSASKTFGLYGLRLGALIQMTTLLKEADLFVSATSYFARATWSNVSHLGMEIIEKTLTDEKKKQAFTKEILIASNNLAKRAELFIASLQKYQVPFAPYVNGFFVLILVDNESFENEIAKKGAYGCHFGKGYRVALSSINLDEAPKLGDIIGQAYQKTLG